MDSPNTFVEWQNAYYTDEYGNTVPIEVKDTYESINTKGFYTFTTLCSNITMGDFAAFNITNCSVDIYFDDDLVYSCTCADQDDAINMNNIEVPFSASADSCVVKMVFSCPNGENVGIFPPMLNITSDYTKNRFPTAAANYFAIPSGVSGLIFIMLCGLLLLGIAMNRADLSLILLALAAGSFTIHNMVLNNGFYFIPEQFNNLLQNDYISYMPPAAVLLYISLNRKKKLFRYYIYICIAIPLMVIGIYLISAIRQSELAKNINQLMISIFANGAYESMLHWISLYIITACAIAALIYHTFSFADVEAEANRLKIQNEIARKSYDTVLKSFRQSSGLRHRWKSDIITLHLMYKQNKINEIGQYLDKLNDMSGNAPKVEFSDNYVIDSIVHYGISEAEAAGIKMTADIDVDKDLNIPDEDLCTFLVNMLDNAIEACQKTDNERFIELRIKKNKGFLSIKCRNSCIDNENNSTGHLSTTKKDKLNHGFGLEQMERIAKKYNSILDISIANGVFTVQTTLSNTKA